MSKWKNGCSIRIVRIEHLDSPTLDSELEKKIEEVCGEKWEPFGIEVSLLETAVYLKQRWTQEIPE